MTKDNIRVLVVDDTVTYRMIVRDVLGGVPGIEVVGTASNGKIALKKIDLLDPDILTLDLEMPEMDGLEVLRQLQRSQSHTGAIVLSGSSRHGAEATIVALELGAFDFVAKPDGGTPEENIRMLQEELCPRIKAFARRSRGRKILPGHQPPSAAAATGPPSAETNDAANRIERIVPGGEGPAEVITVGISTGGPQALNRMLPQLPADLSAAVLLVQHMPPVFTKSLADDLDRHCALKVSEAVEGQPVSPGHVLVAPGGKQMKVVKEADRAIIRLTDDPPENSCRPSVDYLFRSVARAYGPKAIGVIMTGMGSDGSLGCEQMKRRGATIVAQDEASCVVFGMPREPIEKGIADVVAPLDEIAMEIVRLTRQGMAACK